MGEKEIKVAVAHGLANAQEILEEIKNGKADYQFAEIMACPGGCIMGGGQPIVSSKKRNDIDVRKADVYKRQGAQIVVVTVQSLGGQSIEEYATELFRKFGIGDKEKNNGVLLLCSTGDRLFRIEVGYGLEGRLTDGKTGRIQDEYIIPYLKENDYDGDVYKRQI